MHIQSFPYYLFWNYAINADLPESIVLKQVIQYGDLPDIALLCRTCSAKVIRAAIKQMDNSGMWQKRVNARLHGILLNNRGVNIAR